MKQIQSGPKKEKDNFYHGLIHFSSFYWPGALKWSVNNRLQYSEVVPSVTLCFDSNNHDSAQAQFVPSLSGQKWQFTSLCCKRVVLSCPTRTWCVSTEQFNDLPKPKAWNSFSEKKKFRLLGFQQNVKAPEMSNFQRPLTLVNGLIHIAKRKFLFHRFIIT